MTDTDGVSSASRPDSPASTRTRRETWGLVFGATLMSTGVAAYEIAPASVTPLIRSSLGIGPTIAGLIIGTMMGTAVVASLPAGAILDRTSSRTAIVVASLTLVLAGLWGLRAGLRGDYVAVIASRILGGLVYVIVWNAGIDLVSRGVDPAYRATAVGVFTASGPVGFSIGLGVGPLVAEQFGWAAIFAAFTGLSVLGSVVFWPASRTLATDRDDAPTRNDLGSVLRNGHVLVIGLLALLIYGLYFFVNSWAASYLTTEIGLSMASSGLLVAVFPGIGVVSRISGGALSDRVFDGRRRPVVVASFGMTAPLLLVFTHVQNLPVLGGMLLLTGFAVQLTIGLLYTFVREVVDRKVAATAVAILTSVGMSGAFFAPIVGGAVIRTAGYDVAFTLSGAVAILGLFVTLRVPEPGGAS